MQAGLILLHSDVTEKCPHHQTKSPFKSVFSGVMGLTIPSYSVCPYH